jgi:hypothetical protein
MQLRFKLRHKGSTQKLNLSSLPMWSTITERIGRAFSLAPEDVALAYKGNDDTETLLTSREELDEYIKVNDIQKTGKTMEFEVRDSRAWSSLAGSDIGGARISEEYDDLPDVYPLEAPTGSPMSLNFLTTTTPSSFLKPTCSGHLALADTHLSFKLCHCVEWTQTPSPLGSSRRCKTSEENINPGVRPAQRDDDTKTASITSRRSCPIIPMKDKGKAQEVSEREKASDLSKNDGHVDNKPTNHVPKHADPPTPIAPSIRRTLKTSMFATTAAQRDQTRLVPPMMF